MATAGLGLLAALLLLGGFRGGGGAATDPPPWTVSGLEAALQAQHGGGEAEEDSLAAAEQRLRKAIALPPPELRSGAGGMSLSAGAADVAAACRGELCDRVRRFVLAAGELPGLAEAGACAVQHCPDALGIGTRPLPYNAFAFGNRCEPLWSRGAVELVRQLADGGGLTGLEWFTGSSTSWLLARLAHLTSVEAAQPLADKARSVARLQFEDAWLERAWELRVVPPRGPVVTFADTESEAVWEEYCALRWLAPAARFDVIAVQGFARMACLRRAVALLPPQGGLLVLPQAQRPAYSRAADVVPAHWLRFRDAHDMGETLVWMSIDA